MRQLERANAELHRANLRMGRAWLGVHDAAAGAVEARRVRLEAKVAELEQLVHHHKTALEAPRYRAVDGIRTLAFSMPGVATLLRLRSRMIERRSRAR
jgi:hypothetical protein